MSRNRSTNPTVLILVGVYLPGYKAGGPVRTIANLVSSLGDVFNFKIVTSDRDILDVQPYKNVLIDQWHVLGKAEVYYASPMALTPWGIRTILNAIEYDVLYLNSFFNPKFSIIPIALLKLGLIDHCPIILAPRGEFSAGALRIKNIKKRLFLMLSKLIGLQKDVT